MQLNEPIILHLSSVYFSALLFSATFRRKVEKLARDILADPVRVLHGEAGVVNITTVKFLNFWMQETLL